METYIKLFDILDHGYTEWRFAIPGLGFMVLGLLLWKVPYVHYIFGSNRSTGMSLGRFFFFFSILWVLGATSLTYMTHLEALEQYTNGDYETISGIVESHEELLGDSKVIRYKIGENTLWGSGLPFGKEFIQPQLKDIDLVPGTHMKVIMARGIVLRVEKLNPASTEKLKGTL